MKLLYLEDDDQDFELLLQYLDRDTKLIRAKNKDEFLDSLDIQFELILTKRGIKDFSIVEIFSAIRSSPGHLKVPVMILGDNFRADNLEYLHKASLDVVYKYNLNELSALINHFFFDLGQLGIRNEKLFDSLLKSLTDQIFIKNKQRQFIRVNQAFCNYLGLEEKEILGRTADELYDGALKEKVIKTDFEVLVNATETIYEVDEIDADHSRKIYETIKSPIIDKDKVVGIVGVGRDITQKKVMEERNLRYQQILNEAEQMAGSSSFSFNPSNLKFLFSKNIRNMVRFEVPLELSYDGFINFVFKEDLLVFAEEFIRAIEFREEFNIEHRIITSKGDSREVRTLMKPSRFENDMLFYGTIMDITSEKSEDKLMMMVQEQERNFIATELHDNLGQRLSAANIFLSTVKSDDPNFQNAKRIINESISEVRNLSKTLTATPVRENGLTKAVHDLIGIVPFSGEIGCRIDVSDDDVSDFVGANLYRICQESLNNLIKYSKAKHAFIEVRQSENVLNVFIEDDGIGFDDATIKKGNGLRNMAERVKRCNGVFRIRSEEGKGCKIEFSVPCH